MDVRANQQNKQIGEQKKYQQSDNVPLALHKQERIELKHKLQNSQMEIRYIEKYFKIFDNSPIYEMIYIDRGFLLEKASWLVDKID